MQKTPKKRRQQNKTSYKKRLGMLKSDKPRIVIRKTNKYLNLQYVESIEAKDKVIFTVSSKDLLKKGWPKNLENSLKNIPASYLTGYLFGKTLLEKKLKTGIIDLGLQRNIHGNRIYAAIKGVFDSGVEIKVNEKVFPSEERLEGKHLKDNVQKAFKETKGKLK